MILKVLTLNLWGAEEPLAPRMASVEAGLRALAPDVVALQEVRAIPGRLPNQAETLAAACGYQVAFGSAAVPGAGGDWGLAILSRGRVLQQAVLDLPDPEPGERRILLSAEVETAAGPLWVHDTHLNYRLQDGRQREAQVLAIEAATAARAGDRPQLLMGDFNACPENEEIRFLRGHCALGGRRTCWQDAWARVHPLEPGWTWSSANPFAARLRFLALDRRIDYVFVTPERRDGRGRVHACRIVFDGEPFASDHFGVYAEVQVAA